MSNVFCQHFSKGNGIRVYGNDCPDEMVKIFVGKHDVVMQDLESLKAANQQVLRELGEIKNLGRENLDTARQTLQLVEEMSRRQGTGEIECRQFVRICRSLGTIST